MKKFKCVLSMRVANELIKQGYKVEKIEPSKNYPDKLVFVFRNSPELDAEFKKFERKRGQ